jgi:hypothetical protein
MSRSTRPTNRRLATYHLLLAFEALIDWQDEPHPVAEVREINEHVEALASVLGRMGVDPDTANAGDYR